MFFRSITIVFIKTRAAIKLLSVLLTTYFEIKNIFRIRIFVSISNYHARASNISNLINVSD